MKNIRDMNHFGLIFVSIQNEMKGIFTPKQKQKICQPQERLKPMLSLVGIIITINININ